MPLQHQAQRPRVQSKIKRRCGRETDSSRLGVGATLRPVTAFLPPVAPLPRHDRYTPVASVCLPSFCTRFPGLLNLQAALVTFDVWPKCNTALCSTNATRLGSFHVNLMMRTGIHVTDSIDNTSKQSMVRQECKQMKKLF